jgi:hypothetical protein
MMVRQAPYVGKCGQAVGGMEGKSVKDLSPALHGLSTRSWRGFRQDVHMEGCVRKGLALRAIKRL